MPNVRRLIKILIRLQIDITMWKEKIIEINKECTFYDGALESDLLEVEKKLNTKLPVQLKEVLLETDGVTAEYGERLIWSASEIIKHNIEFRQNSDFKELYMPFDHLLFFGDDGGGDQFAYGIIRARDCDSVLARCLGHKRGAMAGWNTLPMFIQPTNLVNLSKIVYTSYHLILAVSQCPLKIKFAN